MAGLIIGLITKKLKPKEFQILPIGTGTGNRANITDFEDNENPDMQEIYRLNINNQLVNSKTKANFVNDIVKVSKSILGDPPDSATFMAYTILDSLLSKNASLVRINPCLSPKLKGNKIFDLPDAYQNLSEGRKKFIALLDMDMDAVESDEVLLISELAENFIVNDSTKTCIPNQLVRGDAAFNFLGQPTYREAKARWLEIINEVV